MLMKHCSARCELVEGPCDGSWKGFVLAWRTLSQGGNVQSPKSKVQSQTLLRFPWLCAGLCRIRLGVADRNGQAWTNVDSHGRGTAERIGGCFGGYLRLFAPFCGCFGIFLFGLSGNQRRGRCYLWALRDGEITPFNAL
jgi:hypothetical protein